MADIPLSWKLGIDNVSDESSLPHGTVRDCVNIDIERAGGIETRSGFASLSATRAHSLWSSPANGNAYAVIGGILSGITYNGTSLVTTSLRTLRANAPLSFDDLTDGVVCGNMNELLRIDAAGVRSLGIEDPAPPLAVAAGSGGLSAGRYAVVVTFLRGNDESGASPLALVDVAEGGGIAITLPDPVASDITTIRVYRTQPNGDVLYRANDYPAGGLMANTLGLTPLGRQCDTRFMQQLPGGQLVRYWRGHTLVARGRNLLWSESMRYGAWTPTDNFVQFPHRIRVLQPVEGGVFVGTQEGVFFLAGQTPDAWELRRTGGEPVVEGSGLKIATSQLGGERDHGGAYAALWLARNGFVIGTADGSLVEPQSKRISLPESQVAAGVGASVVHERRVLTSIN
jgi:hypothetical protein